MNRKPTLKSLSDISPAVRGDNSHWVFFANGKDDISDNLMLLTVSTLDGSARFDWHSHDDFDEIFMVRLGTGEVAFETGEKFKFKPGSVVNCPAGIKHMITNESTDQIEFVFIRVKL